jgi:hypothetical protein
LGLRLHTNSIKTGETDNININVNIPNLMAVSELLAENLDVFIEDETVVKVKYMSDLILRTLRAYIRQ